MPKIENWSIAKSDKFHFKAELSNSEYLNSITCYYDNDGDGFYEPIELYDNGTGNDVTYRR
ncbi:MAG: hypothetical protein R2771_13440 [Saprospiraceae bacterium]